MMFPVADLPVGLRELAYALPLFHVTELNRLLMFGTEQCVSWVLWVCPLYLLAVTGMEADPAALPRCCAEFTALVDALFAVPLKRAMIESSDGHSLMKSVSAFRSDGRSL